MTELEELEKQRNRIDRQINSLKSVQLETDGAKMFKKTGDYWVVTLREIDCRQMLNKRVWRYRQLVMSRTKREAIQGLKVMIDNLTELYNKVTSDGITEDDFT